MISLKRFPKSNPLPRAMATKLQFSFSFCTSLLNSSIIVPHTLPPSFLTRMLTASGCRTFAFRPAHQGHPAGSGPPWQMVSLGTGEEPWYKRCPLSYVWLSTAYVSDGAFWQSICCCRRTVMLTGIFFFRLDGCHWNNNKKMLCPNVGWNIKLSLHFRYAAKPSEKKCPQNRPKVD